MLPLHVSSKLVLTISLLKAVFQFKYRVIHALQICSRACHILAHFLCVFVASEVSSFLEGDVIKEKLSNISGVLLLEAINYNYLEGEQGNADHSLLGTQLAPLQVPRQGLPPRAAPLLTHHEGDVQPELAW